MAMPKQVTYLGLLLSLYFIAEISGIRILYIVTSSSKRNHDGSDRLSWTMLPVIETSIQSMLAQPNFEVDLFLILAYKMKEDRDSLIRSRLPSGVGLEVWDDATPIFFQGTHLVRVEEKNMRKVRQISRILSRQHRYVVKDKLMEYDFFVVMEDDMLVHGEQIQYHLRVTQQIEQLKRQSPETVHIPAEFAKHPEDALYGNFTKQMAAHLWPGFIRVEVLQQDSVAQEEEDMELIPVDLDGLILNASICCRMNSNTSAIPSNDSLMIWETGVAGVSTREVPTIGWVVFLAGTTYPIFGYFGVSPETVIGKGYKPDRFYNLTHKAISTLDPRFIAQSGGWMATRNQLIELHTDLCQGGFFPPFDVPHYVGDGLWGFNSGVEYWSGGMQMWTQRSGCNLQRIIGLHDFSYALLYHTANNKQRTIMQYRRVLAKNLLGQLNSLILRAKQDRLQSAGF